MNPWDWSKWDTYVKIIGSPDVRRLTTSFPGLESQLVVEIR
jgi:hypothetical protein